MNLKTAIVTGYFSMPSASLAEHNPSAYNVAMASMPAGAGTCANCGMGIRHHVVVRTADGRTAFIGSDCASRMGGTVARCVRHRATAEQQAAMDAKREDARQKFLAECAEEAAMKARRAEAFADVLEFLERRDINNGLSMADNVWAHTLREGLTFYTSLARQLRNSSLSPRQADCVARGFCGRRCKKNAAEFDALCDKLTTDSRDYDKQLLFTEDFAIS